jgi:hypothetical protein
VELRFVPEDLSHIDVFFEGKPAGAAIPFVIGRHTHKRVPQAAPDIPEATGIDYLGMVAATHEAAAGTGTKIDFAQLSAFSADDTETGDEVAQ